MMRRARSVVLVVAALVIAARVTAAHDFWLVPDAFQIGAGGELLVRGQTSSAFPTSESAVTVDRVTAARVIGASDEETIGALSMDDRSLVLRHRPRTAGQKIIAVSVGWRHVKETAESFRKYLVLEGAEDALKRYDQNGQLPTSDIVRRYAKYAKTTVEVGDGPRAYDRIVDHPLEFVALSDPAASREGSELRVRLLFNGQPLARARVHAGAAPTREHATKDVTLTTSGDGTAVVPLVSRGLWNVRTIHVVPAPRGADAQWDVHWATYVFSVK